MTMVMIPEEPTETCKGVGGLCWMSKRIKEHGHHAVSAPRGTAGLRAEPKNVHVLASMPSSSPFHSFNQTSYLVFGGGAITRT